MAYRVERLRAGTIGERWGSGSGNVIDWGRN